MLKLSQAQKIIEFLKDTPKKKFNARQIAEQIVNRYPEDYREKQKNPRFENDKAFIGSSTLSYGN